MSRCVHFINKNNNSTNLASLGSGNTNVIDTKTQFSALNLSFELNPKIQVDNYGIFSKLTTTNLQESNNQYLQNNISEEKTLKNSNNELYS